VVTHLAQAERSVEVLLVATGRAATLGGEDKVAAGVADEDGAVRTGGAVLVATSELGRVASLGDGEEANGGEDGREIHLVWRRVGWWDDLVCCCCVNMLMVSE
jgi:hypothetical protein